MARERGMVLGGRVVPGTEDYVLRDTDAWFAPGSRGTRPRSRRGVEIICGHWTAGREIVDEPGASGDAVDDAGSRVFRSLRGRKRDDGSPMEVGVEFVIAATTPRMPRAEIWQLADPIETACVHVSKEWNPRSVGIERCMPGTVEQAHRLGVIDRLEIARMVAGRSRYVVDFWAGEALAFVWLCEVLARELHVPRVVPVGSRGGVLTDRFTSGQARRWKGAAEHYLSPSTSKIDTAGLGLEHLLAAGWTPQVPR